MFTRVLKNSFAMMASAIIIRAGDLVVAVLATRMLHMDHFGKYVLALSFYSLFRLAGDGGLQHLLIRDMAQKRELLRRYFGDAILFELAWSGVLGLIYCGIVIFMNYPADTTIGLFLILIALLPDNLAIPPASAIQACERMEYLIATNTITVFLRIVSSVGALLLGYGFRGILVCLALSRLGGLIATHRIAVAKVAAPVLGFRWKDSVSLAKRLIPFLGITVVSAIFLRADTIVLSRLANDHAVAIFGAGQRLMEPAFLLAGSFALAVYPTLASAFNAGRKDLSDLYVGLVRTVAIGSMLIVCVGHVIAKPLVSILFPAEYSESALILRVFLWYLACFAVDQISGRLLLGIGRQDINLKVISVGAPLAILLMAILTPIWGALGVAIADLIAMAAVMLMGLIIVGRKIPEAELWKILYPPFLAALISLGLGELASQFGWPIQLAVVMASVSIIAWRLGIIGRNDMAKLAYVVKRARESVLPISSR